MCSTGWGWAHFIDIYRAWGPTPRPLPPPPTSPPHRHINAWMCRIYCHKVIKLSDAVQPLPRQETMFVHGVSPSFLKARSVEGYWGNR